MLRFADPDRRADIMEDMAHVYYDMAGFSEQKQLEMLLRNVDESHLLYGSDTPYTDITACVGQAGALENTEKITQRQKQMLFTDNALALLPKLHTMQADGWHPVHSERVGGYLCFALDGNGQFAAPHGGFGRWLASDA